MPPKVSMSVQAAQWTIDPQDSCRLFTRFPPEIQQEIFSFALSEHDSHWDIHGQPRVGFPIPGPKWLVCDLPENTSKPMPEHSSLENIALDYYSPREDPVKELVRKCPVWLRPGTSAARFQHTSLLRTCRRIFLEARDLLMKNATIRFPGDLDFMRLLSARQPVHCTQRMTRYNTNRLTSLEVYPSQMQLEYGFFENLDQFKNLLCIEDLRITLRKNHWYEASERSGPQLTPYGNGRGSRNDGWKLMQKHMALEEEHRQGRAPIPPISFASRERKKGEVTWGESFSLMPNLKRLTMDFDYSEDQFEGLKELAEWAQRVWTFRLGGKMKGYYLSAKDHPVKMYSWRGLVSHMGRTIICPNEDCPKKSKDSDEDDSDDSDNPDNPDNPDMDDLYYTEKPECCAETYKRMRYGFGPRMYTFTVTWTARKLEPEDGDDPSILGPDELVSRWPEGRDDILTPKEQQIVDLPHTLFFQMTRQPLE